MKKFLAIVMAVAMVMSISVTAFADEVIGYGNGDSQVTAVESTADTSVYGQYVDSRSGGDTIYCVEIKWNVTNIVYTESGSYAWDPETLQYSPTGASSVATDGSVTVGVENRSNAAISASVDYADAGSYGTDIKTWTTSDGTEASSATLDSAAVDSDGNEITYTDDSSTGTAQYESFTGDIIVADYTALPTSSSVVGTVTITISEASDTNEGTTE